MGDRKKTLTFGLLFTILITGLSGISSDAFADKKEYPNTTPIINLGYLQLAAHDFFDMNRTTMSDNENGKLDLSTVLFNPQSGQCNFKKSLNQEDGCSLYDDTTIANGGEIRSVENIMISTASAEVGEKYLEYVGEYGPKKAYGKTLDFYHEQLKKAYEETFHLKFPKPKNGDTSNIHNLAVRSGHDLLPAEIMFNGKMTSIFMINPLGEKLSPEEKMQASSPVDGEFDEEFTGIDFCPIPPDVFCIKVDLLFADQSFGEQFGLGADRFDSFMEDLEDGRFDKKDEVSKLLKEAFSYGLHFD
jgi:hypothetical protein